MSITLSAIATRHPRLFDAAIRLDRVPAWAWLTLQAAALTPAWVWMIGRASDGLGDLPGLLALAALPVFVWQQRRTLRPSPRLGWLALALALTLAATLGHGDISVLLALPSLCAGLLAFLPREAVALPLPWFGNTFANRTLHKAVFGLAMTLCMGLSAAHALQAHADAAQTFAAASATGDSR
jgi:hypothetical protein